MRTLLNTVIASALLAAASSARAVEFTPEVNRGVEACIDAALQKHPGQVIRWDIKSRAEVMSFRVDVVATDDLVWTVQCEAGAMVSDERKLGNMNYKMLSSRVKVPEATSRQVAVEEYPGMDLTGMTYELTTWRRIPHYAYRFLIPDGRDATVEVNAGTGRIDRTYSSRAD